MSKKEYHITDWAGGFRDGKDFENWLKVVKHFREKGINHLSIIPFNEAVIRQKILQLYKDFINTLIEHIDWEYEDFTIYDDNKYIHNYSIEHKKAFKILKEIKTLENELAK